MRGHVVFSSSSFILIGLFLFVTLTNSNSHRGLLYESHLSVIFDTGSEFLFYSVRMFPSLSSFPPSWSEVNFESFSLSSLLS